jgi:uncharacterized RDD family membrane protein YckC
MATDPVRLHAVRTPEGIRLPFRVAPVRQRVEAFLMDLLILSAGTLAVWLLALLTLPSAAAPLGTGLALLASFFLRSFYFIVWEVKHGGATLGKRASGLRVIARDGGPLTAEAVFARNLTRDVEIFLPLSVLLAPRWLTSGFSGGFPGGFSGPFSGWMSWMSVAAAVWLFAFAALPLCNRDRLRCGDLVAGTLVVQTPVPVLLPDLAEPAVPSFLGAFPREQLDLYGIEELHTLEDLLRQSARGALKAGALDEAAERIRTGIGGDLRQVPSQDLLQAFYAALRGRLEQKLLFGEISPE